jgi:hypothetical protein
MKASERRQYAMLLRVRDFGATHGQSFSAAGAPAAFAAVSAAIEELATTAVMKRSASMGARADRKAETRKALRRLLVNVGRLARVLRAGGQTLPAFELPVSKSDQALLTAARQFARDTAAFDADFGGHGMSTTRIAAATARFETALRDRSISRSITSGRARGFRS